VGGVGKSGIIGGETTGVGGAMVGSGVTVGTTGCSVAAF